MRAVGYRFFINIVLDMEEVHYRGEGPHWAVELMKKNNVLLVTLEIFTVLLILLETIFDFILIAHECKRYVFIIG